MFETSFNQFWLSSRLSKDVSQNGKNITAVIEFKQQTERQHCSKSNFPRFPHRRCLSPGRIVHPVKSNRKRKRSHSAYICRICPICRIRHEFDSKAKEATTINPKLRYIEVNIYLITGHNPRNEKPRALLCTKSFPSFISPRASWQKKRRKTSLQLQSSS